MKENNTVNNTMTNPASTLRNLAATADQLGVHLPATLVREADELQAAARRLREHRHNHGALVAATVDALRDGRDPATDPLVQEHVTRAGLFATEIGRAVEQHVADLLLPLLREHTPAIVDAFGAVVTDADTLLTQVREQLPDDVDLTDPLAAIRLQPGLLQLWGEGRQAVDRVQKVVGAWSLLTTTTGQASTTRQHLPLVVADLGATGLDTIGSDVKRVHDAGVQLVLATPDTYRERVGRAEREREQAAAERQAEAQRQITGRRQQPVDVVPFGG